ncbi:PRC-barrel domain-containing protein [Actinosynnema sp. NPDC020468]|uniref:PRC-barrel domain-containing protein n=1 Tax=Actinosynnema sp. NPDC020468 TaxID=3154488 RepID=UPI003402BF5C
MGPQEGFDMDAVERLYECDVLDRHGDRIGPVTGVWLDGVSGRPLWAAVRTGEDEALVPIRGAQVRDTRLVLPVERHEVEHAPRVSGDSLSDREQLDLYDHYGLTLNAPGSTLVRHPKG